MRSTGASAGTSCSGKVRATQRLLSSSFLGFMGRPSNTPRAASAPGRIDIPSWRIANQDYLFQQYLNESSFSYGIKNLRVARLAPTGPLNAELWRNTYSQTRLPHILRKQTSTFSDHTNEELPKEGSQLSFVPVTER